MFAIYRAGGHARVRPTQPVVRAVAELLLIGYREQCLWKGRNLCAYYFAIVCEKSTRACIECDLRFLSYILSVRLSLPWNSMTTCNYDFFYTPLDQASVPGC